MNLTARVPEPFTGVFSPPDSLFVCSDMTIDSQQICFGLNPQLDQQSFSLFLQLAGQPEFADFLSKKLPEEDILSFVDFFTRLLKRHLTEDEYHRLFLLDDKHSHPHPPEGHPAP